MRPLVEVTMACRSEPCGGRVHLRRTRRGGRLLGVCDGCGEVAFVDIPLEGEATGQLPTPLVGAAS